MAEVVDVPEVTEEEKNANNKSPGLDGVPNVVLKAAIKTKQ